MQPHHRQTIINRVRAKLVDSDFPRFKMLLIVALTGVAGFLSSFVMLKCGIISMAMRYPIATGIAYLVFLLLLWLWLRTSAEEYADLPDLASSAIDSSDSDFDAIPDTIADAATADEFLIPLLLLMALFALTLSALWIIYSAPVLFAELLIDGALSATLYRRLRNLETHHWLETAIRRTIIPFAITAVVVSLSGAIMHHYYPSAKSLGEVLHCDRTKSQPEAE